MDLKSYLSRPGIKAGALAALARDLKVAPSLVSQWKNETRPIPIERCTAIERETHGAVSRRDLRPDDWHLIWPELVTPETVQPSLLPAATSKVGAGETAALEMEGA